MMGNTETIDAAALAASLSHWWGLAGLDVAVQESPRDWLTRTAPLSQPVPASPIPELAPPVRSTAASSPTVAAVSAPAPLPTDAMPDDLDGFMSWLAENRDQPEAAFSRTRILPHAIVRPDVLVITDMPTQDDMAAGALFSSQDGQLLSTMLRSVGIDRAQTATASLLMARPAGGIMDDMLAQRSYPRLHHFIKLIEPRAIISFGDKTDRAFSQTNGDIAISITPPVNREDGTISAMFLPAPFVLLKHPERKAAAWAQLRYLAAAKR